MPVQLGGGLRDLAAVERALALGVDRVVLGTIALRDPELVRDGGAPLPGARRGRDRRQGRPRRRRGLDRGERGACVELARRFEDAGVAALIHTEIGEDTQVGENVVREGVDNLHAFRQVHEQREQL